MTLSVQVKMKNKFVIMYDKVHYLSNRLPTLVSEVVLDKMALNKKYIFQAFTE